MYGKTKEETYAQNKAFMLNPDKWPATGSLWDRIYLKRYQPERHGMDLAQLVYDGQQWTFCRDYPEPDPSTAKTGGPELIEEILKEGWIVD